MFNLYSQNSQPPLDTVIKKIIGNLATCVVNYEDSNGNKYNAKGCGFILGGEYLATCYHLLDHENCRLLNIHVQFNYSKKADRLEALDSAQVDLNYKYLPTQYDFSKHHYDPNDNKTDFVILKLNKRFPEKNLEFNDAGLMLNDPLYCIGLHMSETGSVSFELPTLSFISYLHTGEDSVNSFISFIGHAHEGFSGTAIYNSSGAIVGIVNKGWETMDEFKKVIPVSEDSAIFLKAQEGYANNKRFGMGLRAKFILKEYFAGAK